jgi:hypothetical protein
MNDRCPFDVNLPWVVDITLESINYYIEEFITGWKL